MQPRAIVLYQKLLPGSQLLNRLQDLHYHAQAVNTPQELIELALAAPPMVVPVDLGTAQAECLEAIRELKRHPQTTHLPVIGFVATGSQEFEAAALASGVSLLVSDAAVLLHLPQCLERVLQVD